MAAATSAQVVATVVAIKGEAYAVNAQGEKRLLKAGDAIYEGEKVVTAAGGQVELAFADGHTMVVLPNETFQIGADMMAEAQPAPQEAAVNTADIQKVIQALEQGLPIDESLEAAAAGVSGGGDNAGHSFVQLLRISEGLDPLAYEFPYPLAYEIREPGGVATEEGNSVVPPTVGVEAIETGPSIDEDGVAYVRVTANTADATDVLTGITVTIPEGWTAQVGSTTYSGTFTLPASGQTYSIDMEVRPPEDSDVDGWVVAVATAADIVDAGLTATSAPSTLPINVNAVLDDAIRFVSEEQGEGSAYYSATGAETDAPIVVSLNLEAERFSPFGQTDGGLEDATESGALTVSIDWVSGIPNTVGMLGTWDGADPDTFVPLSTSFTGTLDETVAWLNSIAVQLPTDWSGSLDGNIRVTYTDTPSGDDESTDLDNTYTSIANFNVYVSPEEGDINVVATNLTAAETDAAVEVSFNNLTAVATDIDDSENINDVTVTLTGVPAGTTGGTGWVISGTTATWTGTSAAAVTSITLPKDYSGTINGTLAATTDEGGSGSSAFTISVSHEGDINVRVDTFGAYVESDAPMIVNLAEKLSVVATDIDYSENVTNVTVTLKGLDSGLTMAGWAETAPRSGVYTWSGSSSSSIPNVTVPADWSGTVNGNVSGTTDEGGADNKDFSFTITPTADIDLVLSDAEGKEDLGLASDQITAIAPPSTGPIALGINASISDADGSETLLSLVIAGVPAGVTISDGTNTFTGDGSTTVDVISWNLANLKITALPADSDADFDLTVTATSNEGSKNGSIHVLIDAVADKPVLSISAMSADGDSDFWETSVVSGNNRTYVGETGTLTVTAKFQDNDGSESHVIVIDMPSVTVGQTTYTFTASNLGSLPSYVSAKVLSNGDIQLTLDPTYSGTFNYTFNIKAPDITVHKNANDPTPSATIFSATATATELVTVSGTSEKTLGDNVATATAVTTAANILDGAMITNTNVTNQAVILTFADQANGAGSFYHAFSKLFDLNAQGQQGSVTEDVGFNIDDANKYNVTLEHAGGTKAIVTDLVLEGQVIIDRTTQLEPGGAGDGGGDKNFAVASVIDVNSTSGVAVQAPILSTDDANQTSPAGGTVTDPSNTGVRYLFGGTGDDTINGGDSYDVIHGGAGSDTLNGGAGNDILVYDKNDAVVDGGLGNDILRIDDGALALFAGSGSTTVDFTTGAQPAFTSIEGLLLTQDATSDPTKGTTVILNQNDVLDFNDQNALYIMGGSGDKLQLKDAGGSATSSDWAKVTGDSSTPAGFDLYQSVYSDSSGEHTLKVYVEQSIEVTKLNNG